MTHCTMDDLLALQANEASGSARAHLAECAACREELDRLYQRAAQLKALPALTPPRDRWPAIRRAVVAARSRRVWRMRFSGLAAAAALAGLALLWPIGLRRSYGDEIAKAKQQSAVLDSTLQEYDPDSRVVSGQSAALAAQIEDQIAAIDGELVRLSAAQADGAAPDLAKLWRQRVDLMQKLLNVRVTRAAYVGL
ncbi:MAG TPA: hypothetical protein VFK78_09060 [Gemmatimonadales bacterium]|nr:hypothetical protein [Gemmatimonadales bacterium]